MSLAAGRSLSGEKLDCSLSLSSALSFLLDLFVRLAVSASVFLLRLLPGSLAFFFDKYRHAFIQLYRQNFLLLCINITYVCIYIRTCIYIYIYIYMYIYVFSVLQALDSDRSGSVTYPELKRACHKAPVDVGGWGRSRERMCSSVGLFVRAPFGEALNPDMLGLLEEALVFCQERGPPQCTQ